MLSKLQNSFDKHPHIVTIKGQGLMLGIELDVECRNIPRIGLKHHLLFNVVSNNTIRLLPALILQEAEADEICLRLIKTVDEFYNSSL